MYRSYLLLSYEPTNKLTLVTIDCFTKAKKVTCPGRASLLQDVACLPCWLLMHDPKKP